MLPALHGLMLTRPWSLGRGRGRFVPGHPSSALLGVVPLAEPECLLPIGGGEGRKGASLECFVGQREQSQPLSRDAVFLVLQWPGLWTDSPDAGSGFPVRKARLTSGCVGTHPLPACAEAGASPEPAALGPSRALWYRSPSWAGLRGALRAPAPGAQCTLRYSTLQGASTVCGDPKRVLRPPDTLWGPTHTCHGDMPRAARGVDGRTTV